MTRHLAVPRDGWNEVWAKKKKSGDNVLALHPDCGHCTGFVAFSSLQPCYVLALTPCTSPGMLLWWGQSTHRLCWYAGTAPPSFHGTGGGFSCVISSVQLSSKASHARPCPQTDLLSPAGVNIVASQQLLISPTSHVSLYTGVEEKLVSYQH